MIFQRGRAQPPTRLLLTIINHIITIILTIINSILTTLINHQPGMAARYQNAACRWFCASLVSASMMTFYRMVPPFDSVQLVQITLISMAYR